MSNEIKTNIRVHVENGKFKDIFDYGQLSFTQAAVGGHRPIVSVGTSEEDLPTGDIGTLGWLVMRNLDSANYVTWGPNSGGNMVAIGRMEAGEPAVFRLEPGVTLRWKANTAAVEVDVRIYED